MKHTFPSSSSTKHTATMANRWAAPIILISALCFVSFSSQHPHPPKPADQRAATHEVHFFITGKVYCDSCRTQFVTRISNYMKGATVRLECRDREDGVLKYTTEVETDDQGSYTLKVGHEHEDEVCEMLLVKSSDPLCDQVSHEDARKKSARVSLTTHSGMTSKTRIANPIGFMRRNALPECVDILRELGITPDGKILED